VANPTQQVATESVSFDEEKIYWPANPANTSDVTYACEMVGMRFDTGYAEHFDDSFPKLFLGTKEAITSRFQTDTPATDFKYLIRRPKLYQMNLASGTAAIPTNVGAPAYATDSGHVQMNTSGLVNNNLAGMVVDIGRSGSSGSGSAIGILSLSTTSTPASVTVAPPTWGALVGLVCQGFLGQDQTAAATVGGNAANLLVNAGRGGNTTGSGASAGGVGGGFTLTGGVGGNVTGSTSANAGAAGAISITGATGGSQTTASATGAGGPGATITITAGSGGNASGTSSTGNGGAGGSINLVPGSGGTTVGGSAGSPGEVQINGVSAGLEYALWQQDQAAAPAAGSFTIFLASRAYRVKAISCVFSTASTSGTGTVTLDTGTNAPGAGTALLTSTMSLSGTANTVVNGSLIAAINTTTLAAGNRLAVTLGGTLTNLAGAVIQVSLVPI